MISRILGPIIKKKLGKGKAIIILGPRQVGKTTLINEILEEKGKHLFLNGDDPQVQQIISDANTQTLKQIIGTHKLVFIDEAQQINNIGRKLKLITDQLKNVQLLVSGSSAFELANHLNEPLTGRKWEYMMYPTSWKELQDHIGYLEARKQLEQRLIYGFYPEVITNQGNEKEVLQQLAGSYLYKDILNYGGIRKPDLLGKLLRALAFQLGNEVSFNELANLLNVDKNTIINYLDLLQKAFVIFQLNPFSRNLRNEISTSRKIYFYDNGIRNSLIAAFNPIKLRNDIGALWENFLISERIKHLRYSGKWANTFFWRTIAGQEIDYVEERDGNLFSYEFKWNKNKKPWLPKTFSKAYPDAKYKVISNENFESFLTENLGE